MKMKRILAAVMAVAMLVPCLMAGASAAEAPVTRASAVQQLAEVLGADTSTTTTRYTDVPASASYAGAVAWATANGVVTGKTETQFDPNGSLTLAEAATIVARAAAAEGIALTGGVLTYADAAAVPEWARYYMSQCAAVGMLDRFVDANGNINPFQTVTANKFAGMINALRAQTPTRSAIAHVESGYYLGTYQTGVYRFVGMQYGVVDGRFQSAHKPAPFFGVHTATAYGPSAPSSEAANPGNAAPPVTAYMTPNNYYSEGEDCLYLNVWSPSMDTNANKPVLFFIHGGGYSSGSGNELEYYDGANFARTEDAVFVSVNHRLNVLGYTDLSAYGDEYRYSANAGQEDLTLALEWVRDNIAQFGGDPNNVTILGQSGGSGKVHALLSSPRALEVFDKAVACSGFGGITRTKEQTQAAGAALVEKTKETYGLTTDAEALEKLTTMPYNELSALASGTGVGSGPSIDGDLIPVSAYDAATGTWADLSKNVPLMISYTYSELGQGAGTMANSTIDPAVFYASMGVGGNAEVWVSQNNKDFMSEEYMRSVIEGIYGEDTDAALALFRVAYPHLDDFDITTIESSSMRQGAHSFAEARAKTGLNNTYQCEWAYSFPLFGGVPAWHTGGDLPFLFQNVDMLTEFVNGDTANAQKMADAASAALYNFMVTGNPSTDELPWAAYTAGNHATMIFNGSESGVRIDHDTALLEMILKHKTGSGFPF